MNELVLAATIHRVKSCEDKIAQFEQLISTLTAQMAHNRSELASKGLANLIMGTTTPFSSQGSYGQPSESIGQGEIVPTTQFRSVGVFGRLNMSRD